MYRYKHILSATAVFLMLFTGCGGGGGEQTSSDQQTSTEQSTQTEDTLTQQEETEEEPQAQETILEEAKVIEKSSRVYSDQDPVMIDPNGSIQASSMDRIYEIIDLLGMVQDEEEANDLMLELLEELLKG